MNALLDDEDAQKTGFVTISHNVGCTIGDLFPEGSKHLHMMVEGVPIRSVGLHFCYDSPQLRPFVLFLQHCFNMDVRIRFRAHYGMYKVASKCSVRCSS